MKRSEIEKALKSESDEFTPDVFGRVMAQAAERTKQSAELPVQGSQPHKRRSPRRRLVTRISAFLAAAAACLAIVLPIALNNTAPAAIPAYATVCVKINPSVELTVEDGVVTGVRALNKDAAVLLVHSTLDGMSAETACVTVADLAASRNLMTEAGIALYVSGKDEAQLEASIRAQLTASNYKVADSDDAYAAELCERYKITYGKARLAAEVLRKYPQYAESAVVKSPADDLLDILEDGLVRHTVLVPDKILLPHVNGQGANHRSLCLPVRACGYQVDNPFDVPSVMSSLYRLFLHRHSHRL